MAMSSGGGGDLNSDINVTPLVDVMLVLLVIFMITAPMLKTGVKLDLPQGSVSNVRDDEHGKLVLSIDKQRRVYLGDTQVAWSDLQKKLATNQRVQTQGTLYIEADKSLPYGVVIIAMDTAQKAGVTKLLMRTAPIDDKTRARLLRTIATAGAKAKSKSSK